MDFQLDFFLDTVAAGISAADVREETPKASISTHDMQEQLREDLQRWSGMTIALTITDNRSTMMSVRHQAAGGKAQVRLHRMFLGAPMEMRKALAHWIKHPRSRKFGAVFRRFIVEHGDEVRNAESRPPALLTAGKHYELREIFEELNRQFFDNSIDAAISWGRDSGRNTRSIRFGAYYPLERLIRIHPRLDRHFVPPFVIRYIMYHEMLHAHIGVEQTENGRTSIHPQVFKKMETAFPEYKQAVAWIKDAENLNRILRRSRL